MKTKGINSSKEIDKISTFEAEKQIAAEIRMKSMMNSCFTYGSAEKGSHNYDMYIKKYEAELGSEVFNEVYEEQMAYLSGCTIERNVYTDSEGCTYNSLIEK